MKRSIAIAATAAKTNAIFFIYLSWRSNSPSVERPILLHSGNCFGLVSAFVTDKWSSDEHSHISRDV